MHHQVAHASNVSDHHMSGSGLGSFEFMLWMLLWIMLIVLAVIGLIRWLGAESKYKVADTSLEIAKKRYAKGEINDKEYKKLINDLRK